MLSSGITTALVERQKLRCMRVRPTEREKCGSSLLSYTFCYFLGSLRASRDTRACDLSQCRQITPGCLEKGKRPGDREAEKISA